MRSDPRRHLRRRVRRAALVERVGAPGSEQIVPTCDLALGGLGFLSEVALVPGESLRLVLALDAEVLEARARVVHGRRTTDGRWVVGAEFLTLTRQAAERLEAWSRGEDGRGEDH